MTVVTGILCEQRPCSATRPRHEDSRGTPADCTHADGSCTHGDEENQLPQTAPRFSAAPADAEERNMWLGMLAILLIGGLLLLLLHAAPVVFAIALLVHAVAGALRWLRHRSALRGENLPLGSIVPCEEMTMNVVVIATAVEVPEGAEAAGLARKQCFRQEVIPCVLLSLGLFLSLSLVYTFHRVMR